MKNSCLLLLSLLSVYYEGISCHYITPPAALDKAPYPEWAHYHWVWLSNDRANQTSMMQYAKEYMDHNISVGAVDIDSGWSTGYNNFIFDTKKYPNATEMVNYFHSKNIRVILWATSMIDTDSSNYKEAHDNKYLLQNALGEQALISWWHGKGGLLDYSNPDALKWWHDQMENVLSIGIDGWKCDGTDPYVYELVVARGKGGVVPRSEYSIAYYTDFFDHTQKILGKDRLIMSRPVDGFGPIFLDYSPTRVVLSGWVGDDDPTFKGLESALKCYLQSAWAGYPNFGSDIGGYRSGNGSLGRTKELLIRWAQLGAFSPLMENGGNKEHRPWMFDEETLTIYKQFVGIHYQLVPYLLTTGTNAIKELKSSITPLAEHDSFINKVIDDFNPSTYNYMLGDRILVAPIYQTGQQVDVTFPSPLNGSNSWVYWFNHTSVHPVKSSVTKFNIPLKEFGVFIATDAILPLRITPSDFYFGSHPSTHGFMKWYLYVHSKASSHGNKAQSYSVREENGHGLIATWKWMDEYCIQFNITAHVSVHSIVHVDTVSYSRVSRIQETLLADNGDYGQHPLRMYSCVNDVVNDRGGAVITKGVDSLLSVLIYPTGESVHGQSLIMCF